MSKPIELHYWPTPNGLKVSIALEEMGLPYEIHPVNIGAGDQFKPEFLAISPNNRIPAIIDPDGPGGQPISVFESGAILQYLGRKTGQFYAADERGRVEVEEWLFWQVGGLGPMAGQANHFRMYAPNILKDQRMVAWGAARYTNEVERLWGVLDRRLEGREFLAGDYSIADMACWPWMRNPGLHGIDTGKFPRAKAWLEKILARPAAAKATAEADRLRAGPLSPLAKSGAEGDKARDVMFGQRARK